MNHEESARESRAYEKATEQADDISRDIKKLTKLLEEANRKAKRRREGPIKGFLNTLSAVKRMVEAYREGRYTDVPWRSVSMIVAAAIYFVIPFDALPDFIPGLGLLDDMALITWTLRTVKKDVDKFRDWEDERAVRGEDIEEPEEDESDFPMPTSL